MDGGRGRELICVVNVNHPDYEKNISVIEWAPDLLTACKMLLIPDKSEKIEKFAIETIRDIINKATQL